MSDEGRDERWRYKSMSAYLTSVLTTSAEVRRHAKEQQRLDDLARGPVMQLPKQDPATPTLYLVITEGYYDSSIVHGVFMSRELAEEHVRGEINRYASLPKSQQDYNRSMLDAEIQAWRGREQIPA
jgi:hypothetical protein